MECPNCGQNINSNKDYCVNCGTRLKKKDTFSISISGLIIIMTILIAIGAVILFLLMYL
jgi:hypothetical protein